MSINNPYHEGELAVQQFANESEMARINSAALGRSIPAGALRFIEQQSMVVVGSLDASGRVWASLLFGSPGFLRAQDQQALVLDLSQARSSHDDPLWANVAENYNVGMLVIELSTRRRLRVNGRAEHRFEKCWVIDVETAYPNCPKYIQRRHWKMIEAEAVGSSKSLPSKKGVVLDDEQMSVITAADTFFVTSAHPERGVDASHRGGHAGFVQLINERQLRIPDFAGNSMFNTLGNFNSYPYAGLAFIDFEAGRLLQLTGRAEILWDLDDPQEHTGGTRRYWQFDITAWQAAPLPFKMSWELMEASPHIPALLQSFDEGSVEGAVLSLRVEQIKHQSARVKSFRLSALDHSPLPAFEAGAHLPVTVTLPDGSQGERHYSLLSDPNDRTHYQIAVLLEPQGSGGSRYLHHQVAEGDIIECHHPMNDFPMARHAQHTILIAGGIGITPMLAMMQRLASQGKSYELHYSARSRADLVFRDRIEGVAAGRACFYVSDEAGGARLELAKLLAVPEEDVHVYVCGPRGLINGVRDTATLQQWPHAQIHFESFGAQLLPDERPIALHLVRSNRELTVAEDQTILDTLLKEGISVPHQCRRGECGLCSTPVLEGDVDHRDLCLSPEEKADTMCVCVSRSHSEVLVLDL